MDEPEDLKEKLLAYEHRPSDHHRNESDKRTPEENMAVIKLYGGVQFPGGPLEVTPRRLLKKLSTVKKRRKLNNNREQDTAVDDGSSEGQLTNCSKATLSSIICELGCQEEIPEILPRLKFTPSLSKSLFVFGISCVVIVAIAFKMDHRGRTTAPPFVASCGKLSGIRGPRRPSRAYRLSGEGQTCSSLL